MSTITIRNHYLPITYLKHFLNNNNEIFAYKKGEMFFEDAISKEERLVKVVGEKALINWGVMNKLYHADGLSAPNQVEDFFTTEIDDHYNYLLDIVKNHETKKADFEGGLRFLVACMMVRTPDFKMRMEEIAGTLKKHELESFANNNDAVQDWRSHYEIKTGRKMDDERITQLKEVISEGRFDMRWPNAFYLAQAFGFLKEYENIFSDMSLNILESAGKGFFITSDAPVVYFVPPDKTNFYQGPKSLNSPYVELYFPLSARYCIFMSHRHRDTIYKKVDRDLCRIVNYNISHNSRDFIFSPFGASFLDKFIEEYIPYPFKFGFK